MRVEKGQVGEEKRPRDKSAVHTRLESNFKFKVNLEHASKLGEIRVTRCTRHLAESKGRKCRKQEEKGRKSGERASKSERVCVCVCV